MIPLRIIIIIAIKNYERRLESFHSFFERKKKFFSMMMALYVAINSDKA